MRQFCFVRIPFGKKTDAACVLIDFVAVYLDLIATATGAAGLLPVRAREQLTGGISHKPMIERLILC